ncbi:MAG: class I SAM-dependent methyltransferase [Gloeomargarita sp. SKYG116]|nr:class I SAM-dependent methyltransferase [Gloeomargarita sp. SKYG116]MCS7226368.1 class I SAM-dependent methyltransferase [Gloeomargarita sp. SKYB31]MDW8400674.1 class I SAM-dependent methyltransferase [Gloeomargarita sp. SKYGB_i_bin116]
MVVTSPISGSTNVRLLQRYSAEELIRLWQQIFNIDITPELRGHMTIELYHCLDTKLYFFMPEDIAGSERLYQQLQKLDFYYMQDKWEYRKTIQLIQSLPMQGKVLEVGCGRGYFLKKLRNLGISASGIETNEKAVSYAQGNNLDVYLYSLETWVQKHPREYGVVCSFQVLEHIAHPKRFIENCLACLGHGGWLILGVPNADSFIRYAENNLLDMPPHHMTRWCRDTLQSLEVYFPMKLINIFYEPLAPYHIDWYSSIQMNRLRKFLNPQQSFTRKAIYKLAKSIGKKVLELGIQLGLRSYIR